MNSNYICDKNVTDIQKVQYKTPFVLVVHAHWCGACHHFSSNYNTFYRMQKERNHEDQVMSIENDTLSSDMSTIYVYDENNVKKDIKSLIYGFPTIIGVDAYNKYSNYEGDRSPENLQTFLHSLKSRTNHTLYQDESRSLGSKEPQLPLKPLYISDNTKSKSKSKSKKSKSKSKSKKSKSKSKSKKSKSKSKSKKSKSKSIK